MALLAKPDFCLCLGTRIGTHLFLFRDAQTVPHKSAEDPRYSIELWVWHSCVLHCNLQFEASTVPFLILLRYYVG